MKSKRSRLALIGVLAVAISVTVGLVSGSAAEAKKKKKKGPRSVTVSKTTPTPIPAAAAGGDVASTTIVPLTVGKKAKGKLVDWSSVTVTTTFTGSDDQALASVFSRLTAPNGRTEGLTGPLWNVLGPPFNTISGPLTETPDSPVNACFPSAGHPCPAGFSSDPEATLGPPYAGTVGNNVLAHFGGIPARGTWLVKVFNASDTKTDVLNSVSLTISLRTAPPA